eukprot:gb/GEZN01018500.1/.p1 GENE.gb/GEZN01018500.1/~~gb/GEZN01018500.1/.p1  ORF type:complete len:135 (+),score=20.41 gb/GEZN01018500.1/:231-635(+)
MEGEGQKSLATLWGKQASAYCGITVPTFPNLFLLYGPNTNLGHSSTIFMLECEINYTTRCIQHIILNNKRGLEVTERALAEDLKKVRAKTVWNTQDGSNWYKNGEGQIVNNWGSTCMSYWWRTLKPHWQHYVFF